MELGDLAGMVKLCQCNIHKLQAKLLSYKNEVDTVCEALNQKWLKVDRVDGRLISVHDYLLSSLSDVNEHVIKLILHINLNCLANVMPALEGGEYVKHTNKDVIEVHLDMDEEKENYFRRPSIRACIKPKSDYMFMPMSASCPSDYLMPKNKTSPTRIPVMKSSSSIKTPASKQKKERATPSTSLTLVQQQEKVVTTPEVSPMKKIASSPTLTTPSAPVDQQKKVSSPTLAPPPALVYQQEKLLTNSEASPLKKKASLPTSTTSSALVDQQDMVLATPKCPMSSFPADQPEKVMATPIGLSPTSIPSYEPEEKILTSPSRLSTSSPVLSPIMEKVVAPFFSPLPCPPLLWKLVQLPIKPRQRLLLPPKGGTEISTEAVYNNVKKNIDAFPQGTICKATMMFLNIADNCFFVAKWGSSSKPLHKLLEAKMPLQELDQLPDFGEIFAIYDSQDNIIPRCVINASSEGGGYEAYLVDYGEHMHLNGKETIFKLPDEVKNLPAEAIKCYLMNGQVEKMSNYSYQDVMLRIKHNDGNDLQVELIDKEEEKEEHSKKGIIINAEQRQILEEIEEGTSDAVKAVMGFKPTDDQRLCRHYDPKLNGCFKGNTCRLVHELPAPFGATKDVELIAPLLESTFAPPVPLKAFELGNVVNIEVTFISSPTQIYAQFIDAPHLPLIWTKKEVNAANRKFSKKPCLLDMVLSYYSDNCYYRAQIIDDFGGEEYKIFYVDYGNTEFVSLKSLAPCGPEESLKPHRAISCHIEGVVRKPMLSLAKTSEGIAFLKSKILNKQIEVKIKSQMPDSWGLHFLGPFADVPNQLVKRGYALPNEGVPRSDIGQFEFNDMVYSSSSDY